MELPATSAPWTGSPLLGIKVLMKMLHSSVTRAAVVALALGLAACDAPVGPSADVDPDFAVGDRNDTYATLAGVVNVCAFPPVDLLFTEEMNGTFSASATGGDVIGTTFDIDQIPPLCFEAWNATDATDVDVTATLESVTAGFSIEAIVTLLGDGSSQTFTGVNSATVSVNDLVGGAIWFKMQREDIPNGGGEGCTPGYWRQEHHFDSWTGYAPGDLFSSVFSDAFPGQTLLDIVWARGGGLNALGRHTVAALLNASSAGVEYDYTTAEVIDLFNAAYASGDRATIENQKNVFDFLNNQGCGLN